MLEITDSQYTYKGTKIAIGNEKRTLINKMVDILLPQGFEEISIPIIQSYDTFIDKVGTENNNMMYRFTDKGERDLCLSPEYTAIIQKLAVNRFKYQKDLKLFYIQECFRGEKPQFGRYRQFTQFGVEIINPSNSYIDYLIKLSKELIATFELEDEVIFNTDVTRGLDYYKEGKGFEGVYEKLNNSKQICGGGEYEGGVGFAIGLDRLLKVKYG